MSHPRISVCMPIYNSAPYLREAVDSVLSQEGAAFELILVDDCSDDGSREIAQSYAGRDPRVRVMPNAANLGMVANWNRCLELCTGEYVHFLLGDDLLCGRDALALMAAELDRDPEIALVASARRIVDSVSQQLRMASSFRDCSIDGERLIRICLAEARNLIGEPSVVMFRRRDAGYGFDDRYRQFVDLEMWIRLLQRGSMRYLTAPLAAFRNHATQQTVANVGNLLHIDEMLWLLQAYGDILPMPALRYLKLHQLARMWRQHHQGRVAADRLENWLAQYVEPRRFRCLLLPIYRLLHPVWRLYLFVNRLTQRDIR